MAEKAMKIQHYTVDRDLCFVIPHDGVDRSDLDFHTTDLTLEDGITFQELVEKSRDGDDTSITFWDNDGTELIARRVDIDSEEAQEDYKGFCVLGSLEIIMFFNSFDECKADESAEGLF